MEDNTILSSGGFKPTTTDTPLDMRTRVNTRAELSEIDNPYVGMEIYIVDEKKRITVTALKSKEIGGIEIPGAAIDIEEGVEDQVTSSLEERIVYDSETETLTLL